MTKSTNVSIGCEATPEGRIKIFLVEGDLKHSIDISRRCRCCCGY